MRHLAVRCVTALLVALISPLLLLAEFDAARNIIGRWDGPADPSNVQLLQQGGWTAVLLPWPGNEATTAFAHAAARAGLAPIAELGVADSRESAIEAAVSARQAGFAAVAVTADGPFDTADSLRDFVGELRGYEVLIFLDRKQISWHVPDAQSILTAGLWPGVRSPANVPGRGIEVASASREPWIDTNPYLIGYLKGMFIEQTAILGYRPDASAGVTEGRAVPPESVEVALVEAFMAGGNFVISLPSDYRQALLAGDKETLTAWQSLGRTARFLQEHRDNIQQPNRSRIAAAAGTLNESGEILNLMYRRNMFPLVLPANDIPVIDPSRFRALVYANLGAPGPTALRHILGFVEAGGLIVVSPQDRETPKWWLAEGAEKIHSDTDRDHHTLGHGRIVAYRDPILDPSEFALDVIDLVGVQTRDVRLWDAPTVVGSAVSADRGGARVLLVNYDKPIDEGFPARINGVFRRATLLELDGEQRPLKTVKRGDATEVWVDRMSRFALIELR